jgi:hypothetical protein
MIPSRLASSTVAISRPEISFRWDSIHLQERHNEKSLHAVDLWKHQPVVVGDDSYTTTIPAHGVVLIKVSADRRN